MKKIFYLLATVAALTAFKESTTSQANIYQTRYVKDGTEYEYYINYPDALDYSVVEKYAAFNIANDKKSIVALMDSLIDAKIRIGYWCNLYYDAMRETLPHDSILPRLLKLQDSEPFNSGAYFMIGDAYDQIGDTAKAVEYFHNGLDIEPDNSYLWYSMGTAMLQHGDTVSAIDSFTKSLELAKSKNLESQIFLNQSMLEKLKNSSRHKDNR